MLLGSREGDWVLDPFGGSGTTGLVANQLERNAMLVELNPEYAQVAKERGLDGTT
ncbi:MAG: DNA methyltransferase [Planctomycetota bacterium]|nr:DNA methyltransferase [Planctomycetota bacterium]